MSQRFLTVAPSPHIRAAVTTRRIMLEVVFSLCPAIVAATILFGWRALLLVAFCCLCCTGFEFGAQKLLHQPVAATDGSALVTGILLALSLPPRFPLWMAAIGCFVAVVVVKQMFGGIGKNFANPAITARVVLILSFGGAMSQYYPPFSYAVDAVAGATVLQSAAAPDYLSMFLGLRGGCIGECCTLALLLGGLYLVVRRLLNPAAPLAFFASAALMSLCMGRDVWLDLMSGGLVIGAIFMAGDYTTTPMTTTGKLLFGLGCGVVTMVIRVYGNLPDGVSFALLLMNVVTPLIDRVTKTHPFGARRQQHTISEKG